MAIDSPSTVAATPSSRYEHLRTEQLWQANWRSANAFATPLRSDDRADAYIFVAPPFTSGAIHIGHVRSYTLADAYARFCRSRGDAVLFALGFDAFGLPAELSALEHDEAPAAWVEHCRAQMRKQLEQLGYSFDWSRTFATSEPDMYKWTQWLFLKLLANDLIYARKAPVHWCRRCKTVLALAQVEAGCCWRCDEEVRLVDRRQWYLRLSAYNEENDQRIEELAGWNEPALTAQRALLGRIEGVECDAFALDGRSLAVFTPYADGIADAEFIAISPNHPELGRWVVDNQGPTIDAMNMQQVRHGAHGDSAKMHGVIATAVALQIAGGLRPLPLVVSPYVDARFGPTASIGIPTRDATDKMLAANINIEPTILPWQLKLKEPAVRRAVRYRAADFPISRQRAWGTPIPVIYCEACGTVPVPLEHLPVELPKDLTVSATGNTLATRLDFVDCACPVCSRRARRETDTLDCHMDATWIEMPHAVPREKRREAMFDDPELARWLPVSQFIHGADTGGFVLTERMMAKTLRDQGVLRFLPSGEPYGPTLMHEMVTLSGRKMSKHLGDAVTAQEMVDTFGADALRFATLYAAAPARSFNWNEDVLRYSSAFLTELWGYAEPRLHPDSGLTPALPIEQSDYLRRKLASWCRTAVKRITANFETLEMQRATRNVILFLGRIKDFERRVIARRHALDEYDERAIVFALELLIRLMAPISPHIAEELWRQAGLRESLLVSSWPVVEAVVERS
jgi:leucyl-tRNA synthetase